MHHCVPTGAVHLAESHISRDAGIVDEHIDRSNFGHDRPDATDATDPVSHVTRIAMKIVTLLTHFPEPALRSGVAGGAGGDHRVAERGEFHADGFAQATHPACNQGDAFISTHRETSRCGQIYARHAARAPAALHPQQRQCR